MGGMESMVPEGLYPVAWVFVLVGLLCATVMLYDIHVRQFRQDRVAMEAIWPITALYLGPIALFAYFKGGRSNTVKSRALNPVQGESRWAKAFAGGTPGGAAATVAHFIGVPLVVASGLTIAGTNLWVLIIVIALLAIVLLFLFEKFTVGMSTGRAFLTATVIVLAFDIGMGGWMIFLHFSSLMPGPTDVRFFFLMGIGNILGFITAYPVVAALTRRQALNDGRGHLRVSGNTGSVRVPAA